MQQGTLLSVFQKLAGAGTEDDLPDNVCNMSVHRIFSAFFWALIGLEMSGGSNAHWLAEGRPRIPGSITGQPVGVLRVKMSECRSRD